MSHGKIVLSATGDNFRWWNIVRRDSKPDKRLNYFSRTVASLEILQDLTSEMTLWGFEHGRQLDFDCVKTTAVPNCVLIVLKLLYTVKTLHRYALP